MAFPHAADQSHYEESVGAAHALLGPDAWAAGRALSLEAVVAEALADPAR